MSDTPLEVGRRVKKVTTKLYWYGASALDAVLETDLAGNNPTEYVFFGGKRVARRDPAGAVFYFFADHLGSSRIVTNATGTIVDESDYYPFGGERVVVNNDPNPYKFTGRERDSETGLDYMKARYYSSQLGRFAGTDPLLVSELRLVNPQGWNGYAYSLNNPLLYVDNDGQEAGLYYTTRRGQPTTYSPRSREARAASQSSEAKTGFAGFVATMTGGLFGSSAVVAGAQAGRALWTAAVTYFLTPQGQQTVAGLAEGLSQAPPGSMGSLAFTVGRLTDAEIRTGMKLATQKGLHLIESGHKGAEFVDALTRKTYDVMGQPGAFKNWNAGEFFGSINHHVNKAVDYVVIDLAGASKQQIQQIKAYVSTLSKEQQAKIQYIQ